VLLIDLNVLILCFHGDQLLLLILFVCCCLVLLWAIFSTFQTYMLLPSSSSEMFLNTLPFLFSTTNVVREYCSVPQWRGLCFYNTECHCFTSSKCPFPLEALGAVECVEYPHLSSALAYQTDILLYSEAHFVCAMMPGTEVYKKLNSVAWVRKRTMQTKRPPLVSEVSAKFCG
jgi:hypothetical protein